MQIITSKLNLKIVLGDKRNNNCGCLLASRSALYFNVILTKLTFRVYSVGDYAFGPCIPTKRKCPYCFVRARTVCATCLQSKLSEMDVDANERLGNAKFVNLDCLAKSCRRLYFPYDCAHSYCCACICRMSQHLHIDLDWQ